MSYTDQHPPTHLLECGPCGQRVGVDMGRLSPLVVNLFRAHHRGDGHDITETINQPEGTNQ